VIIGHIGGLPAEELLLGAGGAGAVLLALRTRLEALVLRRAAGRRSAELRLHPLGERADD